MTAALHVEERAARWLLRQEDAEWSEHDQAELEAWLAESIAHRVAFYRLEYGWRKVDRLAALRSPSAPLARRNRSFLRFWAPTAIAASVAAVAVLSVVGPRMGVVGDKTYVTAVGGSQTVPLADGSKVELNTDTTLRTDVTATFRRVWLDRGEAYFEVKHDPVHPFVVLAADRRITVLGTKFSVRRDGDRVQVAVIEGRVRVDAIETPKPLPATVITHGDIVIARGDETLVRPTSDQRVASEISWRKGLLTFDQTTLANAAQEFNRYNRKQLIIADGEAGGMRIGGSFDAQNVDAFVRLLREAYGLKVEDNGESVKISS